ncbi:cytidine and dcmp deaminase domain-containing protein 1-like [Limosa lapponica baueri]|uniref:Cytidine and dcmp deaminase domain-containing protein 1-like n=1 Tax=Limosa lapponica baueri TaxID=1758121 RepID=A0A2I0T5C7_LIMLA|nr:cytidine and dcmp deaminase domain-containing protein 1-like [Limosa lapponica baueri]
MHLMEVKPSELGKKGTGTHKTTEELHKYLGPPYMKKEDLCIFLALHMENSPSKSQKLDCKTGILVCEASKPKRIIALGCSTEELHAVPKVLLRFPKALKGCEVYMSRMPCNYCAKLLVQAQVSQVYYWPNFEIEVAESEKRDALAKSANTIFTESHIVAAPYVPTIDNQRKMKKLNSDDDIIPVSSIFDGKIDGDILKCFNLEHLKGDQLEKYKNNLGTAKNCFKTLASCKDEEIIILEEEKSTVKNNPKYTHALQLCDLLASRSDRLEEEEECASPVFLTSSEGDLRDAELITTREPCQNCLKLIQAKNIAKVIWPLRDRNVGDNWRRLKAMRRSSRLAVPLSPV